MNLKFLKKSDILLIVVLLLLCGLIALPKYLNQSSSLVAVVKKDGVEIARIDLSSVTESYEYDLECEPKAKLTVEKGCIYYSYAECHDKICVNTGKLDAAGDVAACIPSKTLVIIEGVKDGDAPDIITY